MKFAEMKCPAREVTPPVRAQGDQHEERQQAGQQTRHPGFAGGEFAAATARRRRADPRGGGASPGGGRPSEKGQIGEGSYEATREYQKNIKSYLDRADVTSDAKAARPATPEEAADLKKAEQEGLSHSKSPGQ